MRIDALQPVIAARLATISRDAPFLDAARMFGAGTFRMLIVCEDVGRAVGIVTRTDAMRHIGESDNPLAAVIGELMVTKLTSALPADDLLVTWQMMTGAGLNHVPVLDQLGTPLGILTADDALKALLEAEEYEEHLLSDYVAGIGYR